MRTWFILALALVTILFAQSAEARGERYRLNNQTWELNPLIYGDTRGRVRCPYLDTRTGNPVCPGRRGQGVPSANELWGSKILAFCGERWEGCVGGFMQHPRSRTIYRIVAMGVRPGRYEIAADRMYSKGRELVIVRPYDTNWARMSFRHSEQMLPASRRRRI